MSVKPWRVLIKNIRRPLVLLAITLTFLVAHHVLVRAMAHGHVAHVLLASGGGASDVTLAVALVLVRFITVIVTPGLALAATAEIVAFLLVGPRRPPEEDDDVFPPLPDLQDEANDESAR